MGTEKKNISVVNGRKKMEAQNAERQAKVYVNYIISEYTVTREHP